MRRQIILTVVMLLSLTAAAAAGPIHDAVTVGDLATVKSLIEAEASLVSAPDSALNLPLHLAALAGHVEIIEYLIAQGAEIDAGDRENTRPLGCAALRGQYDAAVVLVKHGASLEQPDDFGATPILHALQGGNTALFRHLLEQGASLEVTSGNGMSVLSSAAAGGNSEVVELCLERGLNINAPDRNGFTAVHWAAYRNRADIVRLLHSRGGDIEYVGGGPNLTPLGACAISGAVEAAQALIELGADVNYRNDHSQTMLHITAERGHIGTAELFVEHGIDVNATEGWGGTALNYAARSHLDMVRWLLDHGANPNRLVDSATAPLYFAASGGDTAIVGALIAAGADVNVCDQGGGYPIHAAIEHGLPEVVNMLLSAGADPNKTESTYDRTALHTAILTGHRDVAQLLLEHGAQIDAKDNQGHTALYYAARYGHQTCEALLKERGASKDGITEISGTPKELTATPKEGQATVWYLGHSGWAVRTANHLLIFDYNEMMGRPDLPCLRNGFVNSAEIADLPVTVFSTHEHGDHYDTVIFGWRDQVKNISYVLGHQPRDREGYTYIEPRQSQEVDGLRVSTIHSTDAGVGYIVEVDGLTLFHAGDHSAGTVDLPEEYTAEINYVAENWPTVNIAFMPITGCSLGTPESVQAGYIYALNRIHPRVSFPQHSMNNENRYAEFKTRARQEGVTDSILCAEHRGDMFNYGGDSSI